ncbi:MAG TPA: methyltransferase domain-containing protein [Geminicoccus sp.]|jgi:SAM-dependent methyltransferase|uniref:methyltransferase domain-containing protein n=1 Tax=Geminicoccus sp. TaxID=2024832 RepID=UPI002E33679B|nr:methyltransferase domain-containing protein [Geminicoccus sp.]HEX2525573.1 methyltransferase domain-containing protein [Geminicoccus sp.]
MLSKRTWIDLVRRSITKSIALLPNRTGPAVVGVKTTRDGSTGEQVFDADQVVNSLYEAVLKREPDRKGLNDHARSLRNGARLTEVMNSFLRSKEFATKVYDEVDRFPLDAGGPLRIDLDGEGTHTGLWEHVAEVWSGYGVSDPYWSVLTDERWRAHNMGRAEVLDEFYKSGSNGIRRMETWFERNGLQINSDMVCAEYGCGVGRCTLWLARRFRRVVAFDISQPHIDAARAALKERGVTNVDFVLVRGPDDLKHLQGVDVFFSIIVLQHNPPPIIVDILKAALGGLKPGGVAYFQVPTYNAGYSFVEEEYRNDMQRRKTMEMHCVPQRVVFDLAARNGLQLVEIQPDNMTGGPQIWISNTFLMRKSS